MAEAPRPVIETRYAQMFPTLQQAEIDQLRRFGETRTFGAGERLVESGEVSLGMFVLLTGEVLVTQHNAFGRDQPIVTHGPGSFMGELAQLSGRPSLVDAHALRPVEALVIRSQRLRDVLVAEAELGERIMRALILRRVGLFESGIAGPVVVGRADHGDVLRLVDFLRRNGHPHQTLDPDTDSCGTTLLERFHVDPSQLPIVICPSGQMLRNPSEHELARCIGLVRPIDAMKVHDVAIIGAGPARLAAAVYAASEGLTAYGGLRVIGKPAPGETVVVAAASGPVGSVGQLAKIAGARAVGIAGGPEKCAYVRPRQEAITKAAGSGGKVLFTPKT